MKNVSIGIAASLLLILPAKSMSQNAIDTLETKNSVSVSVGGSFTSFGLDYYRNLHKDLWLRIGFSNIRMDRINSQQFLSIDTLETINTEVSGGLEIGMEKHEQLNRFITFRYGINLQLTGHYRTIENQNPYSFSNEGNMKAKDIYPGAGVILGIDYRFNKYFNLGAEINPSIYYHTSTSYYDGVYNNNAYKMIIVNLFPGNARITLGFNW